MPTTLPETPRIAECEDCRGLFSLAEPDAPSEVACPHCESVAPVESLTVREAPPAAPVKPTPEGPELPSIEAPTLDLERVEQPPVKPAAPSEAAEERPASSAINETTASESERPPTVGEWLRRNSPSPAEAPRENLAAASVGPPRDTASEDEEAPSASSKPSLASSLGWRPESLNFGGTTTAQDSASEDDGANAEPDATEPVSNSLEDFRFDMLSTPLSERAEAPAEEAASSIDERAPADGAAEQATLREDEERATAEPFGYVEPNENGRRGWLAPAMAAAGFLAVSAPAAYYVMTLPDPPAVAASGEAEPAGDEADRYEAPEVTPDTIVDPATRPASFDAPATNAAPLGDRYAASDEPAPFALPEDALPATPPATSEPESSPPADVVLPAAPPAAPVGHDEPGLVNPIRYQPSDLQAALAEAEPAARGFAAGTLEDPAQVPTMGQHYARLCRLAEVLTLLDPAASGPDLLTIELESADVFKRLLRGGRTRAESRAIAGPWIDWTGKPHGGVFFAGVPTQMVPAGELTQYDFVIGDQPVPVVMAERIDVNRYLNAQAKEVGVIGVVVERPSERIVGYEGDADRVVWARKTLPLAEPRQP